MQNTAEQPTPIFDALFIEATTPKRGEVCPCQEDDSLFYTPSAPEAELLRPPIECDGAYWGNVVLNCFDLSADRTLDEVPA